MRDYIEGDIMELLLVESDEVIMIYAIQEIESVISVVLLCHNGDYILECFKYIFSSKDEQE